MPSIIFEAKENLFSIASTNVQAIIKIPEVIKLPNSSKNVRGIFSYRDSIYTLIDFRKTLSIKTIAEETEEFKDMINQRENDHVNWLNKLFESVEKNEEFALTTDPHKCAFGKWYDNYSTKNYFISETLKKFDVPHKQIHSIAVEIEELKKEEKLEEAKNKIIETKNKELQSMRNLFSILKNQIQNEKHELAILFERNDRKFAISVDKIHSVEDIKSVDVKNLDGELLAFEDKNFISGLGENQAKELVISVSDELLI